MSKVMRMKRSSGNVFADTGFDAKRAENLRIRGVLMMEIERYISRRGLTQAAAAKYFGVNQPEISNLLHGHIEKFSLDKLVNMATQIGKAIDIKIKPARPGSKARPASRAAV